MKTITIGFSKNKKILSKIIRWITRSGVSHTYIKYRQPDTDKLVVCQASGLSVNIENYDLFLTHQEIHQEFDIHIDDCFWYAAQDFIATNIGKPYSIKQLVGMIVVLIGRSIGIGINNPFRDGMHSFICVEVVANIIGICGAENLTPEDVLQYIRSGQLRF
jgi:hypothetical protein